MKPDLFDPPPSALRPRVWTVGALCLAVADLLQERFNPVAVRGELSGFSRATSGHCYFTLKDASGQLRAALFKRAAAGLEFAPRDGDQVEVQGRLAVYEPRGDLQLIVERMSRAGVGNLYEQFLQRKAALEHEGLFDTARKRPLPVMPRAIGLVTSLQAAALHDVASALQRRVPHIPVVLVNAAVQGVAAPRELIEALSKLYLLAQHKQGLEADLLPKIPAVEVILLVRGGGSIDDLWAFNDEALVRHIAASPVPVVSGVGHETDFTLADFVADLRAPTPTAAAELVAQPQAAWLHALAQWQERLLQACWRRTDRQAQRLDALTQRLGRPSQRLALQRLRLQAQAHALGRAVQRQAAGQQQRLQAVQQRVPQAVLGLLASQEQRLARAALRLELLNPQRVLARGYAVLSDSQGRLVTHSAQTHPGQELVATLADGTVDLTVQRATVAGLSRI
jgi:exodeoxyribonuclease VII large subunit